MKTIAWNVDTQYDFMRPDGALPVRDAQRIEGNLEKLTAAFRKHNIQVVNTADWHTADSEEISATPDYSSTYPAHCLENTPGAAYVPATQPDSPYVIDWRDEGFDRDKMEDSRNIVLYKDKFDVFAGNPHTEGVLEAIRPDRVIVYGVATNVCVDFAVRGLLERVDHVYVVRDAIKELPADQAKVPLEKVLDSWQGITKGVQYIATADVGTYLE